MTQQNQNNTSKQNQDKEQHARELNDQLAKEQKQNELDKQHIRNIRTRKVPRPMLIRSLIPSITVKRKMLSNQRKKTVLKRISLIKKLKALRWMT